MQPKSSERAPKPAHVPEELVRDVDFFEIIHGEEDAQTAWRRLQLEMPPVFWTPRNGGHWMVTRAEDIATVQLDHERFSMRQTVLPPAPSMFPSMIHMDPPDHAPYRRVIMPAFLPRAVAALEEKARVIARDLAARLEPRGECEFIGEFAKVLPIVIFLSMVDLPQQDRERLLEIAEAQVHGRTREQRARAERDMSAYLKSYITARKSKPGDDLISTVVNAEVNGAPIGEDEAYGTCLLLLFGGLDTVASMLGFVAHFLASHPEHRKRLLNEPSIIPKAVEELIRRFGLSNTARLVQSDFDFHGAPFRKGDFVQQPNVLFALDETINKDPLEVDFDRENPRHLTFGSGPHTCPGAVLARREIKVFLEEWLPRIPDFRITPGTKPVILTGMVNAVRELHLSWTPSKAA